MCGGSASPFLTIMQKTANYIHCYSEFTRRFQASLSRNRKLVVLLISRAASRVSMQCTPGFENIHFPSASPEARTRTGLAVPDSNTAGEGASNAENDATRNPAPVLADFPFNELKRPDGRCCRPRRSLLHRRKAGHKWQELYITSYIYSWRDLRILW